MLNRSVKLLLTVFLSIVACAQSQSRVTLAEGSVSGIVVNDKGAAIPQARVEFMRVSGGFQKEIVKFVTSDEDGKFVIEHLAWGKYHLLAKKENDFYPDETFAFYGYDERQTPRLVVVRLDGASPTAQVTITVKRAAAIKGSINDYVTAKSISGARFTLRRVKNPNLWLSTNADGQFRVLVPPDVEFTLEVSAPGYKTLRYSVSGNPTLVLVPGAELNLQIQLTPQITKQ